MTSAPDDPRVDLGKWLAVRGDPFSIGIAAEQDGAGAWHDLDEYGPEWTAQLAATGREKVEFAVDSSNIDGAAADSHDENNPTPELILSLTGEQTRAMSGGIYSFDVQVTGGAKSPNTLYKGRVQMVQDVTDDA